MNTFLKTWTTGTPGIKLVFEHFLTLFSKNGDVTLDFKERPGVSYSLRARHINQKNRTLFVLVDVIDDDPDNRWLSVCFYEDMITDPESRGDLVPGGLLGEDGYCFDMDDPGSASYIEARIRQAMESAGRG
ncbi:hypothetical protein LJC71_00305 [Desulfosarcina sp. OttesenSCG-928-A07]|nr:hypothetical protein [Desulfosarcina sp. OttesenSCG-928-A07]